MVAKKENKSQLFQRLYLMTKVYMKTFFPSFFLFFFFGCNKEFLTSLSCIHSFFFRSQITANQNQNKFPIQHVKCMYSSCSGIRLDLNYFWELDSQIIINYLTEAYMCYSHLCFLFLLLFSFFSFCMTPEYQTRTSLTHTHTHTLIRVSYYYCC